jgi:hypothetical protein
MGFWQSSIGRLCMRMTLCTSIRSRQHDPKKGRTLRNAPSAKKSAALSSLPNPTIALDRWRSSALAAPALRPSGK